MKCWSQALELGLHYLALTPGAGGRALPKNPGKGTFLPPQLYLEMLRGGLGIQGRDAFSCFLWENGCFTSP